MEEKKNRRHRGRKSQTLIYLKKPELLQWAKIQLSWLLSLSSIIINAALIFYKPPALKRIIYARQRPDEAKSTRCRPHFFL